MKRPIAPDMGGHALFEEYEGARVARLRLDRWWDVDLIVDEHGCPDNKRYRPLVIIGINPSDADAQYDDPTIRRCIGFSEREGANGLVMVNAHPGISTELDQLSNVMLPEGCDERHWEAVATAMSIDAVAIVAAFGKPPKGLASYRDRVARVKRIARDAGKSLMCFGTNGDGSPKHPLYLKASTPIVPWWSPPR